MFSNLSIPSFALLLVACRSDKGVTVFNPNPEAEITSHSNGDEVLEGAVITFEGHVGDANHDADQLTVEWKKGTQILCEAAPPASDGFTSCSAVLSPQDTEVTLKVIDVDGGIGTAKVTLEVVPSQEPSCSISTPLQEGIYYSDQLITFSGTITDEEDNPELLTGYWKSNVDGVLSDVDVTPSSSGAVQGYSLLSQGQHAIELHGEDTTGKTCLSSVIIDVGPPNSTPSCEILTPLDRSAGPEGDTVIFTASADDVDIPEDMLIATWSSDKDGVLGMPPVNSDGSISFPYSSLSVDTHLLTLTVADEVGTTCTSSIIYTVGTPPSITIDSPSDGDIINEGEVISFAAMVSDSQDQPDEISLDWSLNGTSISTQGATSSGTAEFSDATLTYGSYNLVVTATDTDGLTDSDQINFTINGIPSQPEISITPDPAYTNDGLSVVIDTDSVDPEGSSVNYTYEWLLEGNVQSAYTTSSLPSSATNKGEEWTVRVTPDDGIVSGEAGTATITISNTAPTAPAISITPDPAVEGQDDLVCSVDTPSSDDDGEAVVYTYVWTDDSGTVQQTTTEVSAESDTFTGSGTTEGTWTCEVTPFDGADYGSASYASVDILEFCTYYECEDSIDVGNSVINLNLIESGEDPLGRYTLSYHFYISTTEVTQGAFSDLMGYQPSHSYGVGNDYPVYFVSWHQAADFTNVLTEHYNAMNNTNLDLCYTCQNSLTENVSCTHSLNPYECTGFSLPTEAEWEYAARSGTTEDFWTGAGVNLGGTYSDNTCSTSVTILDGSSNPPLSAYGWFCGNSGIPCEEVGQKLQNGNGLFDMHGNLHEWMADSSGCAYPNSTIDPFCENPNSTENINKSGYWRNGALGLSASFRRTEESTYIQKYLGIRLARHIHY